MADNHFTTENLQVHPSTENLSNQELGKLNIGVFAYDALKHLGDHHRAALDNLDRGGWYKEQIRRWSKSLFLHIGIAQGRGYIDEQTANGLVSLAEDTSGLSQGIVDNYLDNWNDPDKDKVRKRAFDRHSLSDSAVQLLALGREEIAKHGKYGEKPEAESIVKRADQASLFLRGAPV